MAYKIHRAAIILKDGLYVGVKYPTSELEKLCLIHKKEDIIEPFQSQNLKELKSMVNKRGSDISKEDGIPYISNL